MFTRATGFVIVPIWLLAMGWLVAHDVLPAWTALNPPALKVTEWLKEEGGTAQYTLADDSGRIGRIWTTHLVDEDSIRRDDCIFIEALPFDLAPARITVTSVFTSAGLLDELTILLENRDHHVKLHGERFDHDFSFTLDTGIDRPKPFKVPLSDGAMITGAFHPFSQLVDLHVGQRWRMQVFNPLAAIVPLGDRFTRILVEVTKEEWISTSLGRKKCLVVESPHARAWVDQSGTVLRQEFEYPMIGTLRIEREAEFDRDLMIAARREEFRSGRGGPIRRESSRNRRGG